MKTILEKIKIYGLKTAIAYACMELFKRPLQGFFFRTYSQKGEDLFIDRHFNNKKEGFFVDVGANDPKRFNNTKRFYDRGWSGINIEPDVTNYNKFLTDRMRDTNLNIGIGEETSKIIFYKFDPDTLSTFSQDEAEKYKRQGYAAPIEIYIPVDRLDNVLTQHANGKEIDFLSVDTEGFDLHVLKSNDWNRFKPKLICVESIPHELDGAENENEKGDNHERFLDSVGYTKIYDNGLNSIFECK